MGILERYETGYSIIRQDKDYGPNESLGDRNAFGNKSPADLKIENCRIGSQNTTSFEWSNSGSLTFTTSFVIQAEFPRARLIFQHVSKGDSGSGDQLLKSENSSFYFYALLTKPRTRTEQHSTKPPEISACVPRGTREELLLPTSTCWGWLAGDHYVKAMMVAVCHSDSFAGKKL